MRVAAWFGVGFEGAAIVVIGDEESCLSWNVRIRNCPSDAKVVSSRLTDLKPLELRYMTTIVTVLTIKQRGIRLTNASADDLVELIGCVARVIGSF